MEPREIVETALRSLVDQDAAMYMRWFHDDIVYEAPPQPRLAGRFRYFQEMALALTPKTGARVSTFEITRIDGPGQPIRWVQATLHLQLSKDGSLFPTEEPEEPEYREQEAEHWFGVEGDKIVQVKAFAKAHSWHLSA